jgi:hypothetical protein
MSASKKVDLWRPESLEPIGGQVSYRAVPLPTAGSMT